MPNLLAVALGKPDTTVNNVTAELELLSGSPSEDSRLISDLAYSTCWQIAELGLDPKDTTAKELYQTLISAYGETSRTFADAVGESVRDSLPQRYERIGKILEQLNEQGEVWALRNTSSAKLLKVHQPKRVMKKLGYRSIDSMLKREDPKEIFTAATLIETSRWLKSVKKYMSALSSGDFEARRPVCLVIPDSLWSGAAARRPLVFACPEVGVVAVWPNGLAAQTTTLGVLALVLRHLEDLYNLSSSLDVHYLRPGLGKLAMKLWNEPSTPAFTIKGLSFSWCSICGTGLQPTAELSGDRLPAISCRQSIGRLHPALRWWADNEYLVFVDNQGKSVSLNMIDVAVSHALGADFSKRVLSDGRAKLTDELARRYMNYLGVINFIGSLLPGSSGITVSRKPATSNGRQLIGTR